MSPSRGLESEIYGCHGLDLSEDWFDRGFSKSARFSFLAGQDLLKVAASCCYALARRFRRAVIGVRRETRTSIPFNDGPAGWSWFIEAASADAALDWFGGSGYTFCKRQQLLPIDGFVGLTPRPR